MPDATRRPVRFAVAILLALATVAAYASVLRADFITLDDPIYVVNAKQVTGGLSWRGLGWALTTGEATNWHPLTWISLQADAQIRGTAAAQYHLTNLALHVASAVLLLLALERMTHAFWTSAFVAGIFALHPLHVESVAWIAERKDVLSTLFLTLVLLAYARYVERPGRGRWPVVVALYALGLMSKPMLVTLPFALLLLDWWPLGRIGDPFHDRARLLALAREKAALFVLAAAASAVTYAVQKSGGAVASTQIFALPVRLSNAVVSYVRYLGKTFWPVDMAVYYPLLGPVQPLTVALSLLFLVAITWLALRARVRRPWLAVGWLWYLGILVPVIGLVQVGAQAMADRYTYVPMIGVAIAVAWSLREVVSARPALALVAGASCAAVLLVLGLLTQRQVGYWRNTHALFEHTVAVTESNALAQQCLGSILVAEGDLDGGIAHLEAAIRLLPDYPEAHNNLGSALGRKGRFAEAIPHFQQALKGDPRSADAHFNLGSALAKLNRVDEAIAEYEKSLEIDPDQFEANSKIGIVLGNKGRIDEALLHLRKALAARQGDAETHYWTAVTLQLQGQVGEALREYGAVLKAKPDDLQSINNVAWIRATSADPARRDAVEAVRLAERARDLAPSENAVLYDTLAAAYAEAGRFEEAVTACEKAIALARRAGQAKDVARFQEQLELYRAGKPFRTG